MSKSVFIKFEVLGNSVTGPFDIKDNLGNTLATNVTKATLVTGATYTAVDAASTITVSTTTGCTLSATVFIESLLQSTINSIVTTYRNTSSLWKHLTDVTVYNKFYGKIQPYIIEYPFMFKYHDEITQNIKDFTSAYKYLPIPDGVFNDNAKIQTDDQYFNKAILYNGQQCSGVLFLVPKPMRNLAAYNSYPQYYPTGKAILVTKSDSFYQYNTFWSVVKDKSLPLFNTSCESLSIDKVINQTNMDYNNMSFRKSPLRAKSLLVRHILDDKSDAHLVSQFMIVPSQVSYK
jgi:hypothetical protein